MKATPVCVYFVMLLDFIYICDEINAKAIPLFHGGGGDVTTDIFTCVELYHQEDVCSRNNSVFD